MERSQQAHDSCVKTHAYLAHLVKLIDTHDTAVRQHHRAGLQALLAGLRVHSDGGSETHAGGAATGGGDGQGSDVQHRAQQLTLGGGGVSHEHDVDVTTQVSAVLQIALATAEQLQHQGLLDVLVTEDRRTQRARHDAQNIAALRQFSAKQKTKK